MKEENRGGKREGAGRPKMKDKKILTTIRLPPDVIEWLEKQDGSKGAVILDAINKVRRVDI